MELAHHQAGVEAMLRAAIEAAVGRPPLRFADMLEAARAARRPMMRVPMGGLFTQEELHAAGPHATRDALVHHLAETTARLVGVTDYCDALFTWSNFPDASDNNARFLHFSFYKRWP